MKRSCGLIIFCSIGLGACGFTSKFMKGGRGPAAPSQYPASRDKGGSEARGSQEKTSSLQLQLGAAAFDAYDYTFGSLSLALDPATVPDLSQLQASRAVYVGSTMPPAEETRQILSGLCQNIGLSRLPANFIEASSLPSDRQLFVQWRSHFSVAQKQQLAQVLEQLKAPLRCLLRIRLGLDATGPEAIVAFDPIPDAEQNLLGTSKRDQAIDEGVMLIEQDPKLDLSQGTVWSVDKSPDMRLQVIALNTPDFKLKLESSQGSACNFHSSGGKTRVGNPTSVRSYAYGLAGEKSYKIGAIHSQSLGGRSIAACERVKAIAAEQAVLTNFTCGDYEAIRSEGAEAGCAWAVELVNPNDSSNVVAYSVSMEKVPFSILDVDTLAGSAAAIPESPINPVRSKSTIFYGFDTAQLTSMEQAFDFWIAASPQTYSAYFDNFVSSVIYLNANGATCSQPGVLAYVIPAAPQDIYWCVAAGMDAEAVKPENSPMQVMLMAVTAFHENLHTHGRRHDFEAPDYKPCEGTAASALLAFDAIKTCTEDYCAAFKDFALNEYRAELDYSLQGDARRFAGQCQIWNTGLGLQASDFRT